VGPTAASKILHVLQPAFFVMWDKRILESYASSNPEIVDSGRGCSIFLRAMKQFASELRSEFRSEILRESKPQMDIIDYLHEKFPFDPAKTLAKYLDEYNWVAKTRNVNLPPAWHPCSP
jgi:hypothetical protein